MTAGGVPPAHPLRATPRGRGPWRSPDSPLAPNERIGGLWPYTEHHSGVIAKEGPWGVVKGRSPLTAHADSRAQRGDTDARRGRGGGAPASCAKPAEHAPAPARAGFCAPRRACHAQPRHARREEGASRRRCAIRPPTKRTPWRDPPPATGPQAHPTPPPSTPL